MCERLRLKQVFEALVLKVCFRLTRLFALHEYENTALIQTDFKHLSRQGSIVRRVQMFKYRFLKGLLGARE